MNEILPSLQAKNLCRKWIEELDNSEFGNFLKQDKNGKMFGVLICTDNTVYKAYSGETNTSLTSETFVPALYNAQIMQTLLNSADKDLEQEHDKQKKKEISRSYWGKIKKLYTFHCYDGQIRTLDQIAPNAQAGTGDCCAPRLLSFCYQNNKKPLELAEFFYGSGPYEHKKFYGPCDERCKPILPYLIGLDVVYQDDDIVVVNKPSGLLAIEGRTEDKKDCVASRVRSFYNTIKQPCVHRLDMATSGLMVLAKTQEAHDKLCKDFEERRVEKLYLATVEGKVLEKKGTIDLPIRLDTDNRPHQIVDYENGKKALTTYIVKRIKKNQTELILCPHTGRTHQLRVHCAKGLNCPIVSDPLYGTEIPGKNLQLHAYFLRFYHPRTGKLLTFCEPCQN